MGDYGRLLADIVQEASRIILSKESQIKLALACLLAKGHLLIEDLPGMGKTTLAHVLAKVLGLSYQRIQFTSDLLPADILGVSIYQSGEAKFKFHPGPIFTQVLLADEINRATPKTQSALLEAMEEKQVTAEGQTRPLPAPFFVIATQNPMTQIGTYPLPESQLDRFLMRIELGYPDPAAERRLWLEKDRHDLLQTVVAKVDTLQLTALQAEVTSIHMSNSLLDYVQRLVQHSRHSAQFKSGLSPRAALALLRCAQAWALLEGRKHGIPEDIQTVIPAVVNHRLQQHLVPGKASMTGAQSLLNEVNVV